jgi:sulfoxide reductase heme-binding subunit YedZ
MADSQPGAKSHRIPATFGTNAMSHQYQAIAWNRQKRVYDVVLLAGVTLYLTLFIGVSAFLFPYATAKTLFIRAAGSAAFLLLHIILCIGPLCRLDSTFLPLLYNRRHLGVVTFLLGAIHNVAAIRQFHSLGDKDPLVSLLTSNQDFGSLPDFPFQQLGFVALMILFLMAATSHDFWLRNLTPPVWKTLHMLVYVAYAMLVAHVTLGLLQSETSPLLAVGTSFGLLTVITLHVAAARREANMDSKKPGPVADGFVNACAVSGIPEKCATVVSVNGERVAIFKYDGKISAISNVCRHQNGPLGEGKIIDGCVTCPWHGYQYLPEDGASPPPFTEKVSTFQTRIVDGRVWIDPRPNPPGTWVEPSPIDTSEVIA